MASSNSTGLIYQEQIHKGLQNEDRIEVLERRVSELFRTLNNIVLKKVKYKITSEDLASDLNLYIQNTKNEVNVLSNRLDDISESIDLDNLHNFLDQLNEALEAINNFRDYVKDIVDNRVESLKEFIIPIYDTFIIKEEDLVTKKLYLSNKVNPNTPMWVIQSQAGTSVNTIDYTVGNELGRNYITWEGLENANYFKDDIIVVIYYKKEEEN